MMPLMVKNINNNLIASLRIGVTYSDAMIVAANIDLKAHANQNADTKELLKRYPKANLDNLNGNQTVLTKRDTLVAYL